MNKVNWMLGNYSIMVHYLPDTLIDEKRKSSISGGKYELKKLQIHLRKYWQLYLLLLPAFVYVLIFPMDPCMESLLLSRISSRSWDIGEVTGPG